MADKISNIVDVGGITADIKTVVDGIVGLEGTIKHANEQVIKVTVDYKGVETLQQYSEATKNYQKAIGDLNGVEQQNIQVTQQMNALNEVFGVNMGVSLQHFANLTLKTWQNNEAMRGYAEAINTANRELEKMKGNPPKFGQVNDVKNLTNAIQQNKDAVSSLIVENKLLATEITKANQVISGAVEKRIAKQLEQIEKVAQREQDLSDKTEMKVLENELKKLEAQQATVDKMIAENEKYVAAIDAQEDKLTQQTLANDLKKLEAQEATIQKMIAEQERLVLAQETSEDKATQVALTNDLKKLEAEEATIRKMIADQNKLMEAQDAASDKVAQRVLANELKKVEAAQAANIKQQQAIEKTTVKEIEAAEKATFSYRVMESAKRMAFRFPALLVELAIFAALFEIVDKVTESFSKLSAAEQLAVDRLKEYEDNVKQINDFNANLNAGTDIQKTTIEGLVAIIKDETKSIEAKTKAYNDLKDIMPGVLRDYSLQDIANGKNADSFRKQTNYVAEQSEALKANIALYKTNAPILEKLKEQFYGGDPDPSNHTDAHVQQQQQLTKDYINLKNDQARRKAEIIQEQKDLADYTAPDIKTKKPHPERDAHKKMDAELDGEQQRYKLKVETNKKIYDDSRRTFAEQQQLLNDDKKAEEEHFIYMTGIITKYYGKVGESDTKYTARLEEQEADRLRIINASTEKELKLAEEIQERHNKAAKAIDEEIKKWQEFREKIALAAIEMHRLKEDAKVDSDYAKSSKPFLEGLLGIDLSSDDEIKKLDNKIKEAKQKINEAREEFENSKGSPNDYRAYATDTLTQQNDIDKLELDKQQLLNEKIVEAKKKIGQELIELEQQTVQSINTIRDNQFAKQQMQLEIQEKELQIQSQQKIQAINATTGFEVTKENQVAAAVAQTTAQQNALTQQQNQLALKKAQADKQAAESGIILNTALAIAKTLPLFSNPITIPLGVAQVALITATGAVQYAAAASTPLPQFEHGGVTETPKFIAGEAGPELGITPQGKAMMFNKPGIYNAPIGTDIKTADETQRLIRYAMNGIGYNSNSTWMQPVVNNNMSTKKLEDKIEQMHNDLVQVGMLNRVIKNNLKVNITNYKTRNK